MKNMEKVKFDPYTTVYCEVGSRNKGQPFEVSVQKISDTGLTALVETNPGIWTNKLRFRTSTKNLFN